MVSVPGGRRLSFSPTRWLAWSPGGRYVASARERAIVISRWPSLEQVAEVPVDASDVSWTREP